MINELASLLASTVTIITLVFQFRLEHQISYKEEIKKIGEIDNDEYINQIEEQNKVLKIKFLYLKWTSVLIAVFVLLGMILTSSEIYEARTEQSVRALFQKYSLANAKALTEHSIVYLEEYLDGPNCDIYHDMAFYFQEDSDNIDRENHRISMVDNVSFSSFYRECTFYGMRYVTVWYKDGSDPRDVVEFCKYSLVKTRDGWKFKTYEEKDIDTVRIYG